MPNTYTLISAVTVGAGGAASIDFTSIPSTWTDLVLKVSGRSTTTDEYATIGFNGSTASFSGRYLYGNGSTTASGTLVPIVYTCSSGSTASTFGNGEVYIPNYAGSTNKSMSIDSTTENNGTTISMILQAGLWSNTAAINRVTLTHSGSGVFAQYSTAYLYGVKNA